MRITPIDPATYIPEGGEAMLPSSFLQTPFWARFKASHGWKPLFFSVDGLCEREHFLLTVLVRRFTRFASIAYIPLGPDVRIQDAGRQAEVLGEISRLLKAELPSNTICIRFDPPWGTKVSNSLSSETEDEKASSDSPEGDASSEKKRPDGLFPSIPGDPVRRAPANIQPPDTVVLDLSLSEEDLLAQMKTKWRYNVRLGEKKGVSIRCLSGEEGASVGVEIFYRLYLETAFRDGIAIHSREYYEDLVRRSEISGVPGTIGSGNDRTLFDRNVSVRVYIADHDGDALASIITLFSGEEAVYLYGASSNEKRNLMPAYCLQWQAIRDAKKAGCTQYDFYGIPPENDPSHPMYGLYRFKTGFGGSIVHRVGSLDVACRPLAYGAYRFAEGVRTVWFKKIVKLLRRETRRKS